MHWVGGCKLAKNQCAPGQAPELVGVGEGNASADSNVLGGELLEDVADDPSESSEKKPEEHRTRLCRVKDGSTETAIEGQNQQEHGRQFTNREHGDERERIHAADVCLAVGHVHGAP